MARVSAKGCSVYCGVGEVRGTKARGRKRQWRREGRVGGVVRTNLTRVGLCGP
jgi:hypothetical protein